MTKSPAFLKSRQKPKKARDVPSRPEPVEAVEEIEEVEEVESVQEAMNGSEVEDADDGDSTDDQPPESQSAMQTHHNPIESFDQRDREFLESVIEILPMISKRAIAALVTRGVDEMDRRNREDQEIAREVAHQVSRLQSVIPRHVGIFAAKRGSVGGAQRKTRFLYRNPSVPTEVWGGRGRPPTWAKDMSKVELDAIREPNPDYTGPA